VRERGGGVFWFNCQEIAQKSVFRVLIHEKNKKRAHAHIHNIYVYVFTYT